MIRNKQNMCLGLLYGCLVQKSREVWFKMCKRLAVEREKYGWSKSELSRRSGVGLSEISRIEAGKIYPYPGWRRKIAVALSIPEEELFAEYFKKK